MGASPAHIQVLAAFKNAPRADTDVYWVNPFDTALHQPMLAGWVAGNYTDQDCTVPLQSILAGSAIKAFHATCTTMDAAQCTVALSNGTTLHYDALSLDMQPTIDRAAVENAVPGAKEYAVFTQPLEHFGKLWPQILEHAHNKALHISVVGASQLGIELALALQQRLPMCRVTVIAGPNAPMANYPAGVQGKVAAALKAHNITVLQDSWATIEAKCIQLGSGASLVCNIPLLAISGQAPAYLRGSGLELDAHQYLHTNRFGQSVSHGQVFASPSGTSQQSALALEANLRQVLDHQAPKTMLRQPSGLNLISCGRRSAIASWGTISFQGTLAWHLKDVIDRRWIRPYLL